MAIIATVHEIGYAHATLDADDFIEPLPVGDLVDVGGVVYSGVVFPMAANRFPVPPSAIAFLTDEPFPEDEYNIPPDVLTSPFHIVGAVFPESRFLEPTLGQIWPR